MTHRKARAYLESDMHHVLYVLSRMRFAITSLYRFDVLFPVHNQHKHGCAATSWYRRCHVVKWNGIWCMYRYNFASSLFKRCGSTEHSHSYTLCLTQSWREARAWNLQLPHKQTTHHNVLFLKTLHTLLLCLKIIALWPAKWRGGDTLLQFQGEKTEELHN